MCEALWYFQSKFFGACTLLKSELLLNVSLVDYLVFILIYSLFCYFLRKYEPQLLQNLQCLVCIFICFYLVLFQ